MIRVKVRRPVRALEWRQGHSHDTEGGVTTRATAVPVVVGPLTVEAWVREDRETRRGVYTEVKISHGEVALWHEQRGGGNTTQQNLYTLAPRMIEEGLTEAHKRIGVMCEEAEARLRALIEVRDVMRYVTLRKEHRACRLTLETAHLVMLIFYPEVKRPTWLEVITEDVAVAYNERGIPVARIAYDPDDRRNFRGQAGADAVGYQGFTCILWPEDEEVHADA